MNSLSAIDSNKKSARNELVLVAQGMLKGETSFFEGAKVVLKLRSQVGGVLDSDQDFNAFLLIYSETDHLPYESERHLWDTRALARLEPEYKKTEQWAGSFAREACENLVNRFSGSVTSSLEDH